MEGQAVQKNNACGLQAHLVAEQVRGEAKLWFVGVHGEGTEERSVLNASRTTSKCTYVTRRTQDRVR